MHHLLYSGDLSVIIPLVFFLLGGMHDTILHDTSLTFPQTLILRWHTQYIPNFLSLFWD